MNYSRQRNLITMYVKSVTYHPTAENIYNEVRKIYPNISLGTVYRNLCKLVEDGEILRIRMADGKDRFDGNINYHYHAKCLKCGKIMDIFIDYLSYLDREVEKSADIEILSHDIMFNTICKNCK